MYKKIEKRKEERDYLKGVAELNYKGVHNFSENIPLGSHVIYMVLLYNGLLPHDFHGVNPIITISFSISIYLFRISIHFLPSDLKYFPKGTLPHNSQNLKIPRPKLPHSLALTIIWPISILDFGFGIGFEFEFGLGREGAREGEAWRGTHERVGPVVDDGWVYWEGGGG